MRRIRNVATERHRRIPQNFPRDGRDGYIMDEKELLQFHRDMDEQSFELRCIYHSHPNGKAYFSKEDEARAKMWDEPIYPEALYIVRRRRRDRRDRHLGTPVERGAARVRGREDRQGLIGSAPRAIQRRGSSSGIRTTVTTKHSRMLVAASQPRPDSAG